MSEAYVQIAPNSTGSKIRTIQVEEYMTDTTANTVTPLNVLQQVVSIADEQGQVIGKFVDEDFQYQVIELLTGIRDSLSILASKG